MSKVLALLEQRDGMLRGVSHEVVTAARDLADAMGGSVDAVVCGTGEVEGLAGVAQYGADSVYLLTNEAFARSNPDAIAGAVSARCGDYAVVVCAATASGRDLAPRIAARVGVPLVNEVTALSVEGGEVVATRPVYAGKATMQVKVTASPAFVAVRPNVFTPRERPAAGTVTTEAVEAPTARITVKEVKAPETAKLDVSEASIVVSGGRGLQAPEHFKLVEDLASALGSDAAVGASRAVVDAGWRGHAEQVGQTGKTVSPQLYVAVGISGAVQHLAGMRTSKVIVAINKDPEAPIFGVADYGLVADLFEAVPALTAAL